MDYTVTLKPLEHSHKLVQIFLFILAGEPFFFFLFYILYSHQAQK